MLIYKVDVLDLLKKKGFTTYRLRVDRIIGSATMQKLKKGQMVGIIELGKRGNALKCQPGKLIERITEDSGSAESTEE